MQFNYGFLYNGVRYGWNEKQLYRLPFERGLRTYGLLTVPRYEYDKAIVYNVQRKKLTINRLKILTEKVNWEVKIIETKDCPF